MGTRISFGYQSGKTITYGAYQEDGTQIEAAGQSLPEIGSTGYYTALTSTNLAASDVVIVAEGGSKIGWGQYMPEVSAPETSKVLNVYPLPEDKPRISVM